MFVLWSRDRLFFLSGKIEHFFSGLLAKQEKCVFFDGENGEGEEQTRPGNRRPTDKSGYHGRHVVRKCNSENPSDLSRSSIRLEPPGESDRHLSSLLPARMRGRLRLFLHRLETKLERQLLPTGRQRTSIRSHTPAIKLLTLSSLWSGGGRRGKLPVRVFGEATRKKRDKTGSARNKPNLFARKREKWARPFFRRKHTEF